jgi:hypothetical protein
MVLELTLGFILAAMFVAVYLMISRLWRGDDHLLSGDQPRVTLAPADSSRAIGNGAPRRALEAAKKAIDPRTRN